MEIGVLATRNDPNITTKEYRKPISTGRFLYRVITKEMIEIKHVLLSHGVT
jgi:hypothetical protein